MTIRRIVQAISLLALNTSVFGATFLRGVCMPVLNCHACSLAWFACPVGVFIHYAGWRALPVLAIGMVMLAAVLVGRLLCGWVCPFGTLQALLYRIPSPKIRLPAWTGYVKYPVLALMVLAVPFLLGEATWFSFCRICPASTLQAVIPRWFTDGFLWKGWSTISRLSVLLAVVVLSILSSRAFCRVLCPIGAMLAPFNHSSFWSVRPPTQHCIQCGGCDRSCTTDVNPSRRILGHQSPSDHHDCVLCHECQPVCPVGDYRKSKLSKGDQSS